MLQHHGYSASPLRGVPVYVLAFTSTKFYCLVIGVHRCEQLAQGCYLTARWPGLKPVTIEWLLKHR